LKAIKKGKISDKKPKRKKDTETSEESNNDNSEVGSKTEKKSDGMFEAQPHTHTHTLNTLNKQLTSPLTTVTFTFDLFSLFFVKEEPQKSKKRKRRRGSPTILRKSKRRFKSSMHDLTLSA
jgi:hypothetical protein